MNETIPSQQVHFDRSLIDRYNRSGPRYTSYPTAPHFHDRIGPHELQEAVRRSQIERPDRPLSLYLHIPFCDTVCYYCACNRVVTPDRSRAAIFLEYLVREIGLMSRMFTADQAVAQLHFGGGTPTYLDIPQLTRLWRVLDESFHLRKDGSGEYGIEVDPREVPPGTIAGLAEIGFNRISIGVQDLDPRVQRAVNRIQPLELTRATVVEARQAGFVSINLDLIYGLPCQTVATFDHTLQTVINEFRPDRLAIFNYAHLPQYFPPQRRINEGELPSPDEKLAILEQTIQTLIRAGYVYIGMDHFALPDDELAVAQRQGRLHRNFQGYTTHGDCDLVGMGNTAISQIANLYAQNRKEIPEYYQPLDAGALAIFRGIVLTRDDLIRREVIMRLICDFALDRERIGRQFQLDFAEYFQESQVGIAAMITDGLLTEEGAILRVTPAGRLLIRNICMVFDWYLSHADQQKTFSRTI